METILQIKMLKEKISQNDLFVKNLLKDISKCDSDLQQFNIINAEITTRLNDIRQDLLNFKRLVKRIEDTEMRYNMEKDLDCIQNQFDINLLVARKTIANSQKMINNQARSKLFEYSNQLRNRLDSSKSVLTSEIRANQTSALTDDLYSVSRMLVNEVEKSGKNLETLVSSSALATETSEELKTMSNYIANSKTLLSKYGRRELTDKILTMLAFGFFFGCVIYVFVKRLYLR